MSVVFKEAQVAKKQLVSKLFRDGRMSLSCCTCSPLTVARCINVTGNVYTI